MGICKIEVHKKRGSKGFLTTTFDRNVSSHMMPIGDQVALDLLVHKSNQSGDQLLPLERVGKLPL